MMTTMCEMCAMDGFKPMAATKLATTAPLEPVVKFFRKRTHKVTVVLGDDYTDMKCSCGWKESFRQVQMHELIDARARHLVGTRRMCSDCFSKYGQEEVDQ
jgi:hypothetical protein